MPFVDTDILSMLTLTWYLGWINSAAQLSERCFYKLVILSSLIVLFLFGGNKQVPVEPTMFPHYLILTVTNNSAVFTLFDFFSRRKLRYFFSNFRDGFIFAKLRNFVKILPSRNGEYYLPFIDVGKSCQSCNFKCCKYVF